MDWKQIEAEARRILDDVEHRGADVELTEYKNKQRFRIENPDCKSMHEHNAIVREAMRESVRRGISCRRRLVA